MQCGAESDLKITSVISPTSSNEYSNIWREKYTYNGASAHLLYC